MLLHFCLKVKKVLKNVGNVKQCSKFEEVPTKCPAQLGHAWKEVGNFPTPKPFFSLTFPRINFFRPVHEYFLGLLGVHLFFFIRFSFPRIFFWYFTPTPSPHNFSNDPSLSRFGSINKYSVYQYQCSCSIYREKNNSSFA